MDFNFSTEKEFIRFQAEMDGQVCFSKNSLSAEFYPEIGHLSVKMEYGPIPDLTGYSPVLRNDLTGYCKREENKEISLYEEIFIIGLYKQKIILTITIMDYAKKNARAKTVDDFLTHMPIVRFLASLRVSGVEPEPPRSTDFVLS